MGQAIGVAVMSEPVPPDRAMEIAFLVCSGDVNSVQVIRDALAAAREEGERKWGDFQDRLDGAYQDGLEEGERKGLEDMMESLIGIRRLVEQLKGVNFAMRMQILREIDRALAAKEKETP